MRYRKTIACATSGLTFTLEDSTPANWVASIQQHPLTLDRPAFYSILWHKTVSKDYFAAGIILLLQDHSLLQDHEGRIPEFNATIAQAPNSVLRKLFQNLWNWTPAPNRSMLRLSIAELLQAPSYWHSINNIELIMTLDPSYSSVETKYKIQALNPRSRRRLFTSTETGKLLPANVNTRAQTVARANMNIDTMLRRVQRDLGRFNKNDPDSLRDFEIAAGISLVQARLILQDHTNAAEELRERAAELLVEICEAAHDRLAIADAVIYDSYKAIIKMLLNFHVRPVETTHSDLDSIDLEDFI